MKEFLTWLLTSLALVAIGFHSGYEARIRSTNDRYLISLAEKHETQARYWDTQTNAIITNNTLERNRRDGKKAN